MLFLLFNRTPFSLICRSGASESPMEPLLHQLGQRLARCAPRALMCRRYTHGDGHGADPPPPPGASHTPTPVLLVSRLYQPANLREAGQERRQAGEMMTCKSQRLMQQAGLIHPSNPGCYYYLPATVRAMEKLVRLYTTQQIQMGGQSSSRSSLWCHEPLCYSCTHCKVCRGDI